MTASSTFIGFRPKGKTKPGLCEVDGCDKPLLSVYPLVRKMCGPHVIRFLDPVFRGCGCGPAPCPSCERHIRSGVQVVVIGERENGPRHAVSDLKMIDALRHTRTDQASEKPAGSALRQFQRHRRAFSWGASRQRLIALGLRWDMAMNLLGSSPERGEWDHPIARATAEALAPLLPADTHYVLRAFSGLLPANGFTEIPHPSGLNRTWNDPAAIVQARSKIDRIYK